MKFLCLECDEVMAFEERQIPGDGTLAAVFACPSCSREMAMLTNPMETQLVSSMGVKIGGSQVPAQPMEGVRTSLDAGREDAFDADRPERKAGPGSAATVGSAANAPAADGGGETAPTGGAGEPTGPAPVEWSPDAAHRLERVPRFVRGMVKRIYTDYARERAIRTITPDIMDRARTELGLEGM